MFCGCHWVIEGWTTPTIATNKDVMAGQTDTIINAILSDIEAGVLNPGDGINEVALAGRLGVSRTPLREALKVLASEGIVVLESQSGCARRTSHPRRAREHLSGAGGS